MLDRQIWQVPAYLQYVQSELTDQMISDAEKQLGVELPAAYLEILRFQNGGAIRYRLPDSVLEKISGIGPRWPSITTNEVSEEWGEVSYEIKGLIPIDGDGHWHICLDYRGGRTEPLITYVDIECDSQEPIAESFAGFLKMLRPVPPDYQFVILSLGNIRKLKQAIEEEVGGKFDRASARQHGYQRYIIRKKDEPGNNSIWMSPNTCR